VVIVVYSPCVECYSRYGKKYTSDCDDRCDYARVTKEKKILENKINEPKCEYLYFIKPFHKEHIIANEFGLNLVLKNKRISIYENEDVRFSFDKKVVRVLLYNNKNIELKQRIKNYFYEKQWK